MLMEALTGGAGLLGSEFLQNTLNPALMVLDMPRKAAWQAATDLGIPMGETGQDFAENILGIDRNSSLSAPVGMAAEMLLDPVNLIPGAWGYLAGRGARIAGQGVLNARRTLLKSKAGFEGVQGGVEDLLQKYLRNQTTPTSGLPIIPTGPDLAKMTYKQEVLDAIPTLNQLPTGWSKPYHQYNRVRPEVAQQMDKLGLGYSLADGQMVAMAKPGIMRGKGGVMKPANIEDPLWKIRSYMDTLTSPEIRAGSLRSNYAGTSRLPSVSSLDPSNPHLGFRLPVGSGKEIPLGSLPPDQAILALQGKIAGVDDLLRKVPETPWIKAMQMLGY